MTDPIYARDEAIARLQPTAKLASRERPATVYFNPELFPNAVSLNRVERHYEALAAKLRKPSDPKLHFRYAALTTAELESSNIVKFPKAELIFRQRGFVCDIDVKSFGKGAYNPKTTYRLRNRAAVHFQLSIIACFLEQDAGLVGGAANVQVQLGALMGMIGSAPTPLVSYRGMLLPRQQFWRIETIHHAYSWAAATALEDGQADPYGLCAALPSEIAEQVAFEAQHSRELFGVTQSALLLWQAHTLATLRKAAWQIEFASGTALNKQETIEETLKARLLEAVRVGEPGAIGTDVPKAYPRSVADAFNVLKEAMAAEIERPGARANFYGVSYGVAECRHDLSTEENVLAALHGSTYLPEFDETDESDYAHPLNRLQPLATWICDLKRKRHAILSEGIASLLSALSNEPDENFGHAPLSDFVPLIEARLGAPAWALIVKEVLAMEQVGASREISVVYDWTRDAEAPWFGERRDGVIFIRGPLLDFPIQKAAEWNEKAKLIEEEGGLILHRNRDEKGNVLP